MELHDLINANKQLTFCKKIMSYRLDANDLTLALCFCHLCGNNNDDNIGTRDLKFLYDEPFMSRDICDELSNGCHILIKGKFIEYHNNDGLVNNESWKLSDKAKKELLSELSSFGKKNYQKNLILHNSIMAKTLFYNAGEAEKIEKLASLLQERNYHKIQKCLNGKGMRQGFACLFTGSPGTGKTETVYQIARQTKRSIMPVDISQTKSCWYGESEKRIKEVFDTYRYAVENSKNAPILLFNEADAIIGKRQINNDDSRSTDKTDNRIQNIILQEIENLSGILIATTNLAQNMDNAFERRFLYKITFGKPNHESRANIWRSLLPDLNENWAVELSKNFDLSGGQIENITRKNEVETILSGKTMSLDTLIQYAKDELKNGFNATTRIGFGNG
jgi:ATP-dependent Zn protease